MKEEHNNSSNFLEPVDTCQITGLRHILYSVFGGKRDGLFVEVGAYDGVTYSNTYQLAVAGWAGLYIEPVPKLFVQCVGNHKNHPDIRVIKAVIGEPSHNEIPLYTDGNELFTTKRWLADSLAGPLNVKHYDVVTVRSLDSVLQECNIPRYFDLIVIDVEGAEMDVLRGFSIMSYFPKMVIIETHELHPNELLRRNADQVNEVMRMSTYEKIYCDQVNNIYVRM